MSDGSDNGGGDEEAIIHTAMTFYETALAAVEFLEPDAVEQEPLEGRMAQMRLALVDSDEEQGGDSDAESYGKKEDPAPYRV